MQQLLLSISKSSESLLREKNIKISLNNCVSNLGSGTGVDRCYIFKNSIKDKTLLLDYEYEWCNDGITPFIGKPDLKGLSYDFFPGLYDGLSANKSIHGLVENSDNSYFKEIMEMQGIKSYLFTPIFSNENFWGWIGFDNCSAARLFNEEEVKALHSVANTIGLRLEQEILDRNLTNVMNELHTFIKNSKQAKWEWNLETNKFSYSYNWFGMLGFKENEFKPSYLTWRNLVHPNDIDEAEGKLLDYINGKIKKYEGNLRMLHKNGEYVWIKYSGLKIYNKKNKPIKLIGTHIDITDYKLKEMELRISEDKFKFIAENTTDLICQHNTEGLFTYVSNSCSDIVGYEKNELIGENLADFIHPEDALLVSQIFSANQIKTTTVRFLKKNDAYTWLEIISKPLYENSTIIAYQSSSRDVTSRIISEKEIANALQKEKELNQLKSNFVTMASHQFRTPLTVIYSNIELMEYKMITTNKKTKNDIDIISNRIKNEIDRMTELMNNILIFGKFESGNLKIEIRKIDLTVFIVNLIDTYFSNRDDKRIINFEISGIAKPVYTDENLLMQIVSNLISNAFKYSYDKQNPVLQLFYEDDGFKIKIIDFGIGIPDEDKKHLFRSFFRASNTTTIKGSGLGLLIAKQFTEILNGNIEMNSMVNEGTAVILTFPYEKENITR